MTGNPIREFLLLTVRQDRSGTSERSSVDRFGVTGTVESRYSGQIAALRQSMTISSVTTGSPTLLWKCLGGESGLSKREFMG